MKSLKGFTLIELLVAISIMAVLSVIGLTTYSGVQARARDTRRMEDLRRITTYLELYYQKEGQYPDAPDTNGTECVTSQFWDISSNTTFLSDLVAKGITDKVPVERSPILGKTCSYRYTKVVVSGKTYAILVADLETESGQADDRPAVIPTSYTDGLAATDAKDWAIFLPE